MTKGILFNGKIESQKILDDLEKKVRTLSNKPILSIIRTGDNASQLKFTNIKQQTAISIGITCNIYEYSSSSTTDELVKLINDVSNESTGILVQLPLPIQIDKQYVLNSIPYAKDVEGLSESRFDELVEKIPDIYSPVAKAVVETTKKAIEQSRIDTRKNNILILGKSHLLGTPVKHVLSQIYPNVTNIDETEINEIEMISDADIIISGIGKPNFIKKNMVKDGVIAIDAGFEVDEKGKIHGDFNTDVKENASFFTPVPGGIGPLTVVYIFDNLLKL